MTPSQAHVERVGGGELDATLERAHDQLRFGKASRPVGAVALDRKLLGRRSECGVLDRLLVGVRTGESRVLVIRGETGIGKTALLDYLLERASGDRIVRAAGVESEMELPFAGLHQLCAPMLSDLDRLPLPQRNALATAFGLSTGEPPDRFLVGLAVLNLLSEVSEDEPLICLVDDTQWLDRASAQTLTFVARRLLAERVALVFAVRQPGDEPDLTGLAELVVHGLADRDARTLLDSVISWPVDARVRDRIVAETRGNPLALLELPRELMSEDLAGSFGLPDATALPGHIEESFARRLTPLPPATRLLLLVAAAEPVGDPALVWRAADLLCVTVGAAAPATELVEFGAHVRFRHPLGRSAVYRSASPLERQTVHRALAEAIDPGVDPDRRAWHRAHAASGPDEDVAAELEGSAGRARTRGGLAAAAAFHQRSAELTPEPARRAERMLNAAEAKHRAGASESAVGLLAMVEAGPLDELGRARVDMLRAQIEFASRRGSDAPRLLLRAAKRLTPLDLRLARDTYLDAISAAQFAGHLATTVGPREVAQAALAAPQMQPPRAADLLLDGLATRFIEGHTAAAPILKRALEAFRTEEMSSEDVLRWIWLPCQAAVDVWDDEMWDLLGTRHVKRARETGALTVLPLVLSMQMSAQAFIGGVTAAESVGSEVLEAADATRSQLPPYAALLIAAWQGRETDATVLIEATITDVVARGEALGLASAHWARAVLYNGLGRYEDALMAAELACEHPENLGLFNLSQPELILSAVRSGKPERAAKAMDQLSDRAHASGTDWALGVEAGSRALLSEGESAERLYREAIDRLGRTRVRVELARAHLVYGEWLRRERRCGDAREQLRTASEMLVTMGIEAFAERARRELLAAGGAAGKLSVHTRDDLTAQEVRIARLARDGLSNPEIGARLFISPRTVKYHLQKVFAKLDISSRQELDGAVPNADQARRST